MGNTGTQDKITGNPAVEVTSAVQQLAANTVYISKNPSTRVVFTLPLTAEVGDLFTIIGEDAGGWKVAQNANQMIDGSATSTSGTSGYIQSQTQSDVVTLRCTIKDTKFKITSNRGTLDIA